MKVLIFTGMVIVFISVFFMLFIFDVLVSQNIPCLANPTSPACNTGNSGMSLVIGLTTITLFAFIDIITIWLIFKTLFEKSTEPMFRMSKLF